MCRYENYTMSKKSSSKGQVKSRLTGKSMSFNGRVADDMVAKLRRPRTVPELISGRSAVMKETVMAPKLTKLLVNVTVQRSLGPVHVLMSPESTVGDLVAAALRQYSKEGRRPVLPSLDPSAFDLHYSQFSLESLSPDAKLIELGSRNFFLCPKQAAKNAANGSGPDERRVSYGGMTASSSSSSCSKELATKRGAGWLRFMEFMW